jgi:prevent-host-death family protein
MWTLHEAKNKFSAVVEAALAGQPQGISRRGQPAVVVVSAASYEQLLAEARQVRGSFVDHLLAMPSEGAVEQGAGRAKVAPRDVSF